MIRPRLPEPVAETPKRSGGEEVERGAVPPGDAGLQAFEILGRALHRLGLPHHALLTPQSLARVLDLHPCEDRERYGVQATGGLVVAALAYDEGPPSSSGEGEVGEPVLRLARFARANWYAELSSRLKTAAAETRLALLEVGLDPGRAGAWRHLANSGLPERPLALAAGLGSLGRQGLLLVPGQGPGVVLGLLLLPPSLVVPKALEGAAGTGNTTAQPGALCGSCRACVDACPTGALAFEGAFARELCIQHWTSRSGPLPRTVEAVWENRLYGCDTCIEACPRFTSFSTISPSRGLLGPSLRAAPLAEASDAELRARFRGSCLGKSWIETEALRRNARLGLAWAAGGRGRKGGAI